VLTLTSPPDPESASADLEKESLGDYYAKTAAPCARGVLHSACSP
jgi:hypothetical protein